MLNTILLDELSYFNSVLNEVIFGAKYGVKQFPSCISFSICYWTCQQEEKNVIDTSSCGDKTQVSNMVETQLTHFNAVSMFVCMDFAIAWINRGIQSHMPFIFFCDCLYLCSIPIANSKDLRYVISNKLQSCDRENQTQNALYVGIHAGMILEMR